MELVDDGTMIVGMQWVPGYRAEAVYWDSQREIHLLGRTGGSSSSANDVAVTDTGFVIVGWDGVAKWTWETCFLLGSSSSLYGWI